MKHRQSPHSDTTTNGIRVCAAAQFLPDESDPDRKSYLYLYRIKLENTGDESVRLLSRHWIIVDADGETTEVRGAGVVGEYPELEPGETFEYTSSCPLRTHWGTMQGFYKFKREGAESFDVEIGRFFLVPSVSSGAASAS